MLLRIGAQAAGAPLEEEQRTALGAALRYFRDAASKHTADEEDSPFPRLRSLDRADVHHALANICALEDDHAAAAHRHAELDELGRRWLQSGSLAAPLAFAVIDKSERISMDREMAARRGL